MIPLRFLKKITNKLFINNYIVSWSLRLTNKQSHFNFNVVKKQNSYKENIFRLGTIIKARPSRTILPSFRYIKKRMKG